eukprot:TRINITY_DN11854_c0_g1_i1.p1 TRINITY_DN11854_c0_g1~~TRINITY_DN11854_c0_g1_i1.p1  ORF type:complete len:558 (-),score=136.53 TRINITY_DN11854_c0_g1_i1:50-1723(-)
MAENVPLTSSSGDLHFDQYKSGSFFERNKKSIIVGLIAVLAVVALVVVGLILVVVLTKKDDDDDNNNLISLPDRINFETLIKPHLQGLEAAANATWNVTNGNFPTRSIGPGYDESVNYVVNTLTKALNDAGGSEPFCNITIQNFSAPVWTELGPPRISALIESSVISYTAYTDFTSIRYGGNVTTTISNLSVFNASSGCLDDNYVGMSDDQIAIMDDSTSATCTLYSKAMLAQSKNAAGILMYRSNAPGLIGSRVYNSDNWNISIPFVQIPVISVLRSIAQTFVLLKANVTISSNQSIELIPTSNVFCSTPGALELNSSTIFVGSHLDSVPAGPGINDDGSGSSINLMLALLLINNHYPHSNPIVFGWWGAEEIGLIGSRHFVQTFNSINSNNTLAEHMAYYINMDMLGSPNGMFQLVNSSTVPVSQTIQNSCQTLNDKVIEYLRNGAKRENLLAYTSGGAGSDMMSFWEVGVPMISFATGAGGLMSSAQRLQMINETWGLANAAMDPCYHLGCDTVENVNGQLAEVEARAVGWLLQETLNKNDLLEWLYPATLLRQ